MKPENVFSCSGTGKTRAIAHRAAGKATGAKRSNPFRNLRFRVKKFFQNSSTRAAGPGKPPGFTLVEMLVVVAIIAVLVALLFPLATGMINTAKRTKCVGNLRNVYIFLQAYAQDHESKMPDPGSNSYKQPGTNFTKAIEPYIPTVADRRVFYCPSHKLEDGSLYGYTDERWNTGGISYHYYSLSNNTVTPLRNMDRNMQLLMSDKFNNNADKPSVVTSSKGASCSHPDGLNILRLNGTVEFSKYGVDIRTW